jgi:hypothetical protein
LWPERQTGNTTFIDVFDLLAIFSIAMASVLDYDAAATPRRLQVGTGVGVDFHADSDLDDARCFPSHDVSPWDVSVEELIDGLDVALVPDCRICCRIFRLARWGGFEVAPDEGTDLAAGIRASDG